MQPNSFHAFKLQGECYENMDQRDEAIKSYRTALYLAKKKKKRRADSSCSSRSISHELDEFLKSENEKAIGNNEVKEFSSDTVLLANKIVSAKVGAFIFSTSCTM